MLARPALLIVQMLVGWLLGPEIFGKLPPLPPFRLVIVQAIVFSVVVWLVGVLAVFVLKDVAKPSAGALMAALAGALTGAGVSLLPDITTAIANTIGGVPSMAYPLTGAALGYGLRP